MCAVHEKKEHAKRSACAVREKTELLHDRRQAHGCAPMLIWCLSFSGGAPASPHVPRPTQLCMCPRAGAQDEACDDEALGLIRLLGQVDVVFAHFRAPLCRVLSLVSPLFGARSASQSEFLPKANKRSKPTTTPAPLPKPRTDHSTQTRSVRSRSRVDWAVERTKSSAPGQGRAGGRGGVPEHYSQVTCTCTCAFT